MVLRAITSRLLHSRKYFCDKLWAALSIRWNGDIEPCPCACGDTPIFNALHTPFREAWNSPPYQRTRAFLLRAMGRGELDPVPREDAFDICRNCAVPLVDRYSIIRWRLKGLGIRLRTHLLTARGPAERQIMRRKLSNYTQMIGYLRSPAPTVPCYPILGSIDAANLCNLRCPMCMVGNRELDHPRGRMGLDVFRTIMREVGPALIHLELYRYGEPLLNPELPEMIRVAAREYLCRTRVSTNLAMPLADDAIRHLLDSGLDTLVVAADGPDQETYARYRRGGSVEAVLENLRRIVAARAAKADNRSPRIVWQYLVFAHNENRVAETRRLARRIGVDRFIAIEPSVPGHDEFAQWVSAKRGDRAGRDEARKRQVLQARIEPAISGGQPALPPGKPTARVSVSDKPLTLSAGQPFELVARVRNTTLETWPAEPGAANHDRTVAKADDNQPGAVRASSAEMNAVRASGVEVNAVRAGGVEMNAVRASSAEVNAVRAGRVEVNAVGASGVEVNAVRASGVEVNAVRLGIKLYADDQRHFLHELGRGLLAAPLPPRAECEIRAALHAPAQPGAYLLKLDMVREGETWYEWKTGDRSQPYWLKANVI